MTITIEVATRITPREKQIVELMADGKTGWEIGMILSISEHTVAAHVGSARAKLRAVNSMQLIAAAFRKGILQIPDLNR